MSDDTMIVIAKVAPTRLSKRDWYQEIFKRSEQRRAVGESQAVAFVSFIEKHPDGPVLYQAYRQAPGPDWQPPERVTKIEAPGQTMALIKLQKLAEELRAHETKLTLEQAFSKVVDTPEGQILYTQDKAERLGIAAA